MIFIGHDIDYSYLGLGITCSLNFFNHNLFEISTFLNNNLFENHHMHLNFYFLFCIAKGLATFRLGGVISAQKVQF